MSMKMILLAAAFAATNAGSALAADAESAYATGKFAEALALFEEHGLEGDVQAQELVGMMYLLGQTLYGSDVPADPERAARWLWAAAMNGSTKSRFVLAHMYRAGVGVPTDLVRSDTLLAEATGTHVQPVTLTAAQR